MGRRRAPEAGTLGRALIRQQVQRSRSHRHTDSWLHTSELNDGYDWGRLNLQSITEQSSLDDFLATAELAGTEFIAEKLNIKFVPPEARTGLLSFEENQRIKKLHEENKQFLCIPRRPKWDQKTSPEELKQAEKDNFLEWRRQLVRLEEEQNLILTPFERNLDFWRQLWRVIERSDIVVQIVDARNPLLFRCEDLECYVKTIDDNKENVILVNKADLLTIEQRSAWAEFFEKENVKVIFWSALAEAIQLMGNSKEEVNGDIGEAITAEFENSSCDEAEILHKETEHLSLGEVASSEEDESEYEDCQEEEEEDWQTCSEDGSGPDEEACGPDCKEGHTVGAEAQGRKTPQKRQIHNFSHLVSKQELLEVFKQLHSGKKVKDGQLTIGLVGYPNVGKSSTINTILGNKKVSVSATPGHTKHFQTLYVEPGLCLCDCPGLVMPSFVSTKAEMICSGILPIDQMRDHVPPVSLVCQNIPRHVLEATYGIDIIKPREDEDPQRPPTSEELLTAYGCMRGFMTAHGQPDQPRSARYILKDYVNGKLLYCHPPPGRDSVTFQYQHQQLLDRCFARHRVCISFGLWICACSCWIAVHALLLYLRCGRKSGRDQSALWAACCLLTSLCDTIGAILAKQLTIQVFTGAYLAAVDLVNFVSVLFPVCGSKFKSNSGRGSRERKRRRRLRASVFALVLPLSLGPGWALWAAVSRASGRDRGPQRRLLGVLVQDNTEILGFLLGGIAALGSWVSRIPPLSRICRGKTFPSIHLWTQFLSALAGLLYASAIVAHDRRPEYLLRATPWFLTSLGRAALDLSIIFLSCVMKSKMRQVLGFASEVGENPDTQALLTCAEKEEENQEAMTENSDWVPLTTLPHCKPLKRMAAISRYMELTIEPVQLVSCSANRLPGDGQTNTGATSLQEPPSYPPVQVIQARVSSSSSSQISSINSDLEQKYWEALISEQWDPEDVNLGGNKDSMETLRSQVHRWSVKPVDLPSDE